jgi:NAD(P)H-quinone oxidoreductase subunit 4
VGIGFYPKLAMQMYDAKMVAVNASVTQVYQEMALDQPQFYASTLRSPV